MGMGMGEVMVLLMALMNGAGNDLVDYIDSQTYWQSQGVERTADALAGQLKADAVEGETAQAVQVRRLVAIRTLGELKDRGALSLLKPLVDDRDPFVSEYARRAIATIEGKPFVRPVATDAALAGDVALLPRGCAVVMQTRFPAGGAVVYDEVLKAIEGTGVDKDAARKQATAMLTMFASQTGNFRLHGVTLGVAGDVGDETGFVVVVGRGKYDAAAVRALLKNAAENVRTVGNVEVFSPDRNVALICPSDDRFVFIAGPNADVLPVEKVLAAIAGKQDGPANDPAMAALMRTVDRTKPLWVVAKMTDAYRQAPLLAPFNTMTLVGEQKGDEFHLRLLARGDDPAKVRELVKDFENILADALEQMKKHADQMPMMKDMIAGVESVKTQVNGNEVTVTAAFKGKAGSFVVLPLFLGGFPSAHSVTVPPPE